jgi:hypothetical protein
MEDDSQLISDYTAWLQQQPEAPAFQSKEENILGPLSNVRVGNPYGEQIQQGQTKGYVAGGQVAYNQAMENGGVLTPSVNLQRTSINNPNFSLQKNDVVGGGLNYSGNGYTIGARYDKQGRPMQSGGNMNPDGFNYNAGITNPNKDPVEGGMKNLFQVYYNKQF